MATTETFFATKIHRARLGGTGERALIESLAGACFSIAEDDEAGQAWCEKHAYRGYTSYASLKDLQWRDPSFAELVLRLDGHVAAFAREIDLDLGRRKLELDSLWINILEPGGVHTGHIHPQSVVSGTIYIETPEGASPLKFEDPRLPMMMAAPPRKARARAENRTFVYLDTAPGVVLLWESWLRHEVPPNAAESPRVSVSFNYR